MEILDLIAKISWDTNPKALEGMNKDLRAQDKIVEELGNKTRKLSEQLAKTSDPKKIKSLNDELTKTKKGIDSIVDSARKQEAMTIKLKQRFQELTSQFTNAKLPNEIAKVTRELVETEKKLRALNVEAAKATGGNKFGGIGQSLLAGFGLGGGMAIFQTALAGIQSFVGDSIKEFEDAQKSALDLQRALHVIGKDKYFEGLKTEADSLAKTFFGLFDNDDIIKAQTALVQYGKLTRAEMSQLLPVILELATKTGDVSSATQTVVNILEGRGGQTLRDYGVSVKGVKTEHDRLNIVLGDFQTKLKGSAEVYKDTAEGIAQTNKILVKNIEEQFGESFGKIKNKVLPIITNILNGVNAIISGDVNIGFGVDDIVKQRAGQAANLRAQKLLKGIKADVDWEKTMNSNADLSDPEAEAEAKKKAAERIKAIADAAKAEAKKHKIIIEARIALGKVRDDGKLPTEKDISDELRDRTKQGKAAMEKAFDSDSLREQILGIPTVDDVKANDINQSIITKRKNDEEKERTRIAKEESDKRKQIELEELVSSLNSLASQVSNVYTVEINAIDSLITAQEKRVETAKNSSEKSLQIEQNRLDELVRKREKYERQQRTIDAVVIVANQAVAISAGIVGVANAVKSGNAVLIIANLAAILGGLLAGYSAVRSINAGFKEGGYTGDGDPSDVSTAIGSRPYKYHKKEFVMNEQLTTKHRDMLEGMHNGHLIVNKLNDGYYLSNRTIDADAAVQDFRTSKSSTLDTSDLSALLYSIDKRLTGFKFNIHNNLDVDGFSTKIAVELGRVHILNSRR